MSVTPLYAIAAGTAAVGGAVAIVQYRRLRAVRLVRCPRERSAAAIVLSWARALPWPGRRRPSQVASCSNWPQRLGCAQGCLAEVHRSADGCRADAIIADWYRRRTCVSCCRPIPPPGLLTGRPGVRAPDGRFRTWAEIPLLQVFAALDSHEPVCASCLSASRMRGHPQKPHGARWRD